MFSKTDKLKSSQHFKIDDMPISPKKALAITSSYYKGLGLQYKLSYSTPKICNRIVIDRTVDEEEFDYSNMRPGEYEILVKMEDRDGTTLENTFFVDSLTGETRKDSFYSPSKVDLERIMDAKRYHYVIIETKDRNSSMGIAKRYFKDPKVNSVTVWDNKGMSDINNQLVMSSSRYGGFRSKPIYHKNKLKKKTK